MYAIYDRIFDDTPARNTTYTIYIFTWLWPTLRIHHWVQDWSFRTSLKCQVFVCLCKPCMHPEHPSGTQHSTSTHTHTHTRTHAHATHTLTHIQTYTRKHTDTHAHTYTPPLHPHPHTHTHVCTNTHTHHSHSCCRIKRRSGACSSSLPTSCAPSTGGAMIWPWASTTPPLH